VRPYLKKPITKKGLAEWLKWQKHLPSKREALSSNPTATKKKKSVNMLTHINKKNCKKTN
jgi:hypothetical protein